MIDGVPPEQPAPVSPSVPTPRLNEIRERCDAATPGPWFSWRTQRAGLTVQVAAGWIAVMSEKGTDADADFIAHAREDVPFLLSALSASEGEVEGLSEDYGQLVADYTKETHALREQLAASEERVRELEGGCRCRPVPIDDCPEHGIAASARNRPAPDSRGSTRGPTPDE